MLPNCALVGGFAIRCYDNIARTRKVSEWSVLALFLVATWRSEDRTAVISIISRTKPLQSTLELVLWVAATDDVEHCFSFATRTLASCCYVTLLRQDAQSILLLISQGIW